MSASYKNRAFFVKKLSCQLGLNYVWLGQVCDNVGPFLRLLKAAVTRCTYNTKE